MELQDKKYRILDIFFRLLKGEFVSVRQLANEYYVSGKTVSRDINEIRAYLSENEYRNGNAQIEYSHREKAYYLSMDDFLSSVNGIAGAYRNFNIKSCFAERQYGRNMITVCKVIHPLVMKQKRMSDFGTHINSFSFVSQACLPSFLWYQFF